MKMGLSVLVFSPSFIIILVQFEDNLCDKASSGLVGLSLFCRHFGRFRILEPKLTICLLRPPPPQNGPFYTPRTLRFKGERRILTQRYCKRNAKRTNGATITHVQRGGAQGLCMSAIDERSSDL